MKTERSLESADAVWAARIRGPDGPTTRAIQGRDFFIYDLSLTV